MSTAAADHFLPRVAYLNPLERRILGVGFYLGHLHYAIPLMTLHKVFSYLSLGVLMLG